MTRLYTREVFGSWVGRLFEPFIRSLLKKQGTEEPTESELAEAFAGIWRECSAKLMVQEPWMGTIRFKSLVRYRADEFEPMVLDPMGYLHGRFGGGKFKVNFYRGMHFITTMNFKPEGEPKWKEMPELEDD